MPAARSGIVNTRAPVMPAVAPELAAFWRWLLGGLAVGVAVTLVAALLPTRRVVRVGPLTALRPQAGVDVRTAAGRTRLPLAALALVAGPVMHGTAMAPQPYKLSNGCYDSKVRRKIR